MITPAQDNGKAGPAVPIRWAADIEVPSAHSRPGVRWRPSGVGGAAEDDGYVRVWNAVSGDLLKTIALTGHPESVSCLAFSPDGHWIAVGEGFTKAEVVHRRSRTARRRGGPGGSNARHASFGS